jgi:hypothetical protein
MPQMQGGKGEAIANYREPFSTQQMGYHRLSLRVNKIEKKCITIFHLLAVYKSNYTLKIKTVN